VSTKLTMTKQEADAANIQYKCWLHPVIEKDDWLESDDGIVTKVRLVKTYRNSKGYLSTFVVCGVGRFIKEQSLRFEIAEQYKNKIQRIDTGTVGKRNDPNQWDKLFVDLLFSGMDKEVAGNIAFKRLRGKINTTNVLKKKSVQKYMAAKYQDEMERAGITKDWYFRALKGEAEDSSNRGTERFAVLERIARLLDIVPDTKVTEISETKTAYLDDDTVNKLEQKQTLVLNE
jgi:hypothetical protein